MNYWDNIPFELQNHIKSIVVAQIIQKNWRGHHCRNTYVINIVKKYTDKAQNNSGFYHMCDCTDPQTVIEIEYCVKHSWNKLIQNIKPDLWEKLIQNIEEGLWEKRFSQQSFILLYRRIKEAKRELQERLYECMVITYCDVTRVHLFSYFNHFSRAFVS